MVKKAQPKFYHEDDFKLAKYRWEFLRRNSVYKAEHAELKPGIAELGFYENWKIRKPFNPNDSFEKIIEDIVKKSVADWSESKPIEHSVKEWFVRAVTPEYKFAGPIENIDGYKTIFGKDGYKTVPSEDFVSFGLMTIRIDLNWSKARIKDYFEKKLTHWKHIYEVEQKLERKEISHLKSVLKRKDQTSVDREYCSKRIKELQNRINNRKEIKKFHNQHAPIAVSKKHFNKYDIYLKIWDMRDQYNPPTFKEIGKLIYPDKTIKQAENLVRQNFYAAYKQIYEKEYCYQDVQESRKEVKKEHLAITCDKCPQKDTCTAPCSAVIAFVEQDQVKSGRELSIGRVEYNNEKIF
jgi:hypothetical protein